MRWISIIRKFFYESFGIDNNYEIYKLFRLYYLISFLLSPLFVFYLFYKEDDLFIDIFIPAFFFIGFILSFKVDAVKRILSEILFVLSFLFCGYALYYYHKSQGDLSYFIGFLITFLSLNIVIHYYIRSLLFSFIMIVVTIVSYQITNSQYLIPLEYCLTALFTITLIVFIIHYNRYVLLSKIEDTKKDISNSRDRLLTVINSIDNVVYHVAIDENGNKSLRYLSGQIESILKINVDEYIALSKTGKVLEYVHPEDLRKIKEKTKELNTNKRPVTMKYRFKIPENNDYIWVEEKVFPKFDEKGRHIANIGISANITERVNKEEQLLQSELKYRSMIEKNLSGFYRINLKRIIIECNDSFAEIFGFESKDVLIGKSLDDIYIDSTDRKNFINLLYEKKYVRNHESKVKLNSGKEIWLLENVSYINQDNGYIEGTVFDITQFKNIQVKLTKSEERYKSLFENNVSGVFRTTIDGQFLECNLSFAKIYGYDSVEDIEHAYKNKTLDVYVNPEDRIKYLEDLKKHKTLYNYEFLNKKKDGTKINLLLNVALISDENGKENIIQGTLIDITSIVEFEKVLKESENRYKSLFENNLSGVFRTQLDGKIIDCNESFIKIFGYTDKEEFFKINSYDLYFSHEDRNNYINELNKQKTLKNYELLVKNKKGAPLNILANVVLLKDETGNESIIQGTLIDITALKIAEQETLRAKIIEETNKQLQTEIEKHKITQQKLTEQKYYIDSVLNSSLDMIMATNAKNEIYQVNDAALKYFGYNFDEIKGKSPEVLYAYKKDYLRVSKELKKHNKFVGEVKNVRKNGEVFTSFLSASVMYNKDGELMGAMGVSRDITEILEAEKLVQKQNAKIKSIFESASNILIWTLDKEYKISSFNKNFFDEIKHHFGIETYVGLPFYELLIKYINKNYINETLGIYKNAFKSTHQKLEGKMYAINGDKIWYEVFLSPIKLEDGTINEVSCIAYNITDKKETQLKLSKNEERSRALINALPDLIFRMKNDGTYLDVIYKNENMLFEPPENFIGTNIIDRFNNEMGKTFLNNIQKSISENRIIQYEYALNIKNHEGFFEARYAKINDEEALVIIRDITEKKTAEQELLSSLKEKEVLLKEVHHRVKNNLQVISSILNLQSSYIKDQKILQILRESQNRIKSMSFIHESLYRNKDFSYINFSEYIINLSKNLFYTYQVGDEIINLVFETDNIQLNLDQAIPCGLIVNEILSNALKYAFNENIILPKIKIELKQNDQKISIIIEDNGVGLPPQFDINTSETLGIQLVTTLVEQLDGEIKLQSDAGTKYLITFEKQLIN